ncbi:DUF1127 domain-containing protein [Celeribacter persicus]|uniref:Uncharacterized protein DUF1127 n=1 Tax=Celeribacter persicus TaxID=1651082 RepID=A0A2T5HUF8_9RHOB|nr:DUF1127 domain-containing protein [Celeribacter persicus]PTQ75232.1 uncharacterized protein DUF1127 [Celeribacter persicus]
MATLTHTSGIAQPLFARLHDRLDALRTTIAHRRAQRAEADQVYRELSLMTDRELSDIGISRHVIRDIAREAGRLV